MKTNEQDRQLVRLLTMRRQLCNLRQSVLWHTENALIRFINNDKPPKVWLALFDAMDAKDDADELGMRINAERARICDDSFDGGVGGGGWFEYYAHPESATLLLGSDT